MKDQYVSTEHLLLALADAGGEAKEALRLSGVRRDDILAALKAVRGNASVTSQNPEDTYEPLKRYGRDLVELAARQGKLDPVIGRDEEIRRCMQVLARRTKNNPVLIGEPGVGKTAIVEGLAQRILAGDVPQALQQADRRPGHGRPDRRGEVPRRVRGAAQGGAQGGRRLGRAVILFIDEMHTVVGAGRPRARPTPATCSSQPWPGASCAASARPRSRNTASTSRRTRPSSAASSRSTSASPASRTPSRSCAGSRSATTRTTACASRTARSSARRTLATATSPTGSCPTRRST
jgi:hypothetical protein